MIHLLKRAIASIGGALIPDANHLALFAGDNNNFYVVNSAGERLLLGNGITSITKTGTAGAVDTYTIELTDGTTATITVTNGSVTSVNGKQGNVVLDPLDLTGIHATPETMPGVIRIFGRKAAGRIMAAAVGPNGVPVRFQPHVGTNRISVWMPNGVNTALVTAWGGLWTNTAILGVPLTDTPVGRIRRGRAATAATAAAVWVLNTDAVAATGAAYSRNTGFHMIGHWSPHDTSAAAVTTPTRRFFAGVSTLAHANAPMTSFQGVGVQTDAGETVMSVRGWDGVATPLPDFGAFDPEAWYRFELFCPPLGDFVGWRLSNEITGQMAEGVFTGAQLPPAAQLMHVRCQLMTTTGIQSIAIGHWSIETDL